MSIGEHDTCPYCGHSNKLISRDDAAVKELAELLKEAHEHVCDLCCPSTGKAGTPIKHGDLCKRIQQAIKGVGPEETGGRNRADQENVSPIEDGAEEEVMEMIRVYVAGRYSDDNVLSVLGNISKGIQLCKDLFLSEYAPFCPWLDHQYVLQMSDEERNSLTVPMFHRYSMAWLEASHCMLVIPDRIETSRGTQAEIARAKELGIPVFYSVDELMKWRRAA